MKPVYTTDDEIMFVSGIRNPEVMMGYLKSIKLRTDWGDIDSALVEAHARSRLDKLIARRNWKRHALSV